MNANPEVMRYFPNLLTREESDALTEKFSKLIEEKGWGFWVTERKTDNKFLGLVGLNLVDDLPLPNCIEVGWRLDKPYWGNGYATESATASLHFAFSVLKKDQVSAFTTLTNSPSRKVMARLGMVDTGRNFLHPRVPENSELREHVHYNIKRKSFNRSFQASSVIISER